jgi:glycosyltransferase involved in cell wall biosynthesis
MPKISVLIPVYNAESFIRETIDSVLEQTFQDFELLLMDDSSTDLSAEIIHSYSDPRIHYELCPHNFIGTLNRGLEIAQGKYIARLDHDDLMLPERLQVQYEFMENYPEIVACGAYIQTFGSDSVVLGILEKHEDMVQYMATKGNPIVNPTAFYRRDILMQYGIRHEEGYHFADDFKLWLEFAKVGKLANIPRVLGKYRISDKQASRMNYNLMMAASDRIQQEAFQYFFSPGVTTGCP